MNPPVRQPVIRELIGFGARHKALVTLLGLLITFLLANSRIVQGKGFPLWDADRQFSSWQMLIADFARNGQLLLWNPWSCGGIPEFAEPQSGALSPLAVLCGLLAGGTSSGFLTWWLANWFVGAVGLFFLARHLRTPYWGAFVIASGYLFSGFYTGHAEHISWLHAYSFLPFLVWWFDRACVERSWRRAFETGALWGLSGLAGYPGHLVVSGSVLALWALGRFLCNRVPNTESVGTGLRALPHSESRVLPRFFRFAGRHLLLLGIVPIVGALIISPVYTGYFTEAVNYSTRTQTGGWTRDTAVSSNALDPGALATFASPWLTQVQLRSQNTLWDTDVSSCSMYVGSLIPLLALLALLLRPREPWRWWLLGMAVAMLAISVGDRLPLRGWLYDYLPPFRYFKHSSMFRGYAIFFLAVLAMHGATDLDQRRLPVFAKRGWMVPLAAALLALLALWSFRSLVIATKATTITDYSLAGMHVYAVWLLPVVLGLVWLYLPQRNVLPWLAVLLAALDAGATAYLGRCTIYTEEPQVARLRTYLDDNHSASLDLIANERPRVLLLGRGLSHNKNLEIKIPTLVNYTALMNSYHDRIAASPAVASTALGPNRIWFSSHPANLPLAEPVLEALIARADSGGGVPVVIHPPGRKRESAHPDTATQSEIAAVISATPSAQLLSIPMKEYTPTRLYFSVTCAQEGWLLITDRWSPGWKATVNGRSVPVFRANAVFRSVKVDKGTSDVRFDYAPLGLPGLLVLSWGALALAIMSAGARGLLRQAGPFEISELPTRSTQAPAQKELSIVIPCYNVERHIDRTLKKLLDHIRRSRWDAEIIVVDDGSKDSTSAVAAAVGNPAIRVIRHTENVGKGRAVRTGMLAARGRRRVFTDADLPYDLKDLSAIVSALDEADVAFGNRLHAKSQRRNPEISLPRRLSSKIFSGLVLSLFRLHTTDTQCGLKGFGADASRQIYERSRVNGFSFDVETLVIARKLSFTVQAVPVTLVRSRRSSVQMIRHSIQMFAELVQIKANLLVGRYR